MEDKNKLNPVTTIIQLILVVIIIPFIPLLLTFKWNWWEAWVYGGISVLCFILSRMLAAKKNPDIIRERAKSFSNEGVKSWDKILAPAMGIGGLIIPLVAGLDARFGWTGNLSLPIKIGSLIILILGYTLGSYALITNKFFSGTVRIQKDRGHTVCSSGPYRWIRHPGYVGGILAFLGSPIFLDSIWGLIPVGFLILITIIRTALEDKTLQNELEGYKEYTQKVKYRLIPFIW
jgi:protein-S-isoprenylcysteine O-methyltransferase Ste14